MSRSGKTYLFCGVGGSGMSALAAVVVAQGAAVYGSDRNHDRGLFPELFARLGGLGIQMVAQDGSGVNAAVDAVIVSSAVESSIPDVAAAQAQGIPVVRRAGLLAEIADAAPSVTVAGTNGKTTVTGMIGWILHQAGQDPTIINGGALLNFGTNAVIGQGSRIVIETDESDGSVALFHPDIAVLTNIAEDHKDMAELKAVFRQYLSQSKRQVLNRDCAVVAALGKDFPDALWYGMDDDDGSLDLAVPGAHNRSNALAAVAATSLCGIPRRQAVTALAGFKGIQSRLEVIGRAGGIAVIDDFAHNPDKIAASLKTLKEQEGRLILMYQPHGFGPTKRQKEALIDVFSEYLGANDVLYMPEIYYAGGTADQNISSRDIIGPLREKGMDARFFENKGQILADIVNKARNGDTVCIMGARDDSLRRMARDMVDMLMSKNCKTG